MSVTWRLTNVLSVTSSDKMESHGIGALLVEYGFTKNVAADFVCKHQQQARSKTSKQCQQHSKQPKCSGLRTTTATTIIVGVCEIYHFQTQNQAKSSLSRLEVTPTMLRFSTLL
uniref:Uncharacterized protein n=1 Tax=Timema bartmani TaxID=61472 RepID=A0A7R9FA69_9NEOP|nr:unnamed protein product [Timema bartmani]